MKRESTYRFLAIGYLIILSTLQLICAQKSCALPQNWICFSNLLYLVFIFLASMEFGLLGTFLSSTLSIILASYIHLRFHIVIPFSWLILYGAITALLYFDLTRVEREGVQKRIHLNDLEAQYNDFAAEYSKHKGVVRALKHKITRFSTLRLLGEKLISTLSLSDTSQNTLSVTQQLIPKGDLASLYFLDNNFQTFVLAHQIHHSELTKDLLSSPQDPFNQWILKNRQNLIIEDLKADFRFEKTTQNSAIASLIAAPLISEDKLIGALRMESLQPYTFQLEDLRILATLASVVSTSLKNARLYNETLELSMKDGLTGLYVPNHFHEALQRSFDQSKQDSQNLTLLIADLDDFKKINDLYGHPVGDNILKIFSEIFRQKIHDTYIPTRYGGEEFSAFFPGWTLDATQILAEELRKVIEDTLFEIRREEIHITTCVGISEIKASDLSKDHLLHRADQALYEAKRTGKNRVCIG